MWGIQKENCGGELKKYPFESDKILKEGKHSRLMGENQNGRENHKNQK